jgi:hypothetical protein
MIETFGQRLAARRRGTIIPASSAQAEHVMTQVELAERLCINISTVRNYEQQRSLPHPLVRRAIVAVWPDFFETIRK